MKKRIVCGSAAILMTSLTIGVVTPAKSQEREVLARTASIQMPAAGRAMDALSDGVTVRVRSSAIEAGWHTGRIKRDDRSCSIVQLDQPTAHGYTAIALTVIDALQLGRTGDWTAIDARRALASEPAHCLAAGAD